MYERLLKEQEKQERCSDSPLGMLQYLDPLAPDRLLVDARKFRPGYGAELAMQRCYARTGPTNTVSGTRYMGLK